MRRKAQIGLKKKITKREAVLIADAVKRGMSIKVMKDLEEIKRLKASLVKQF